MARYWDNKEVAGRGTKFCLVIDPEDGTNPIRTYGWDKEEVLEKVAKTAEAAQLLINRQRTPAPIAVPPRPAVTSEELMEATADLSNPGKSTNAIKTILRGAGFDVDHAKLNADAQRVGSIAQEWEKNHPEFPKDNRNKRLLIDKACLLVGFVNITSEALDAAYRELSANQMLFQDAPIVEEEDELEAPTPNAPNGNSATRTERSRTATSYRRNALPSASAATGHERKPKYTRAEVDAMNSKQFRNKYDSEPGFADWYNREFSAAT